MQTLPPRPLRQPDELFLSHDPRTLSQLTREPMRSCDQRTLQIEIDLRSDDSHVHRRGHMSSLVFCWKFLLTPPASTHPHPPVGGPHCRVRASLWEQILCLSANRSNSAGALLLGPAPQKLKGNDPPSPTARHPHHLHPPTEALQVCLRDGAPSERDRREKASPIKLII